MIWARVAVSRAAISAGAVARPRSASAGSVARSTSSVTAPLAASRASAYSTSIRDLDELDGLPEIPTAAGPRLGAMWAAKLFMIPFFTFHYGMFVTVHGIFVLTLFGGGAVGRGFPTPTTFWHAVQAAGIAPAAWGLVLSHAVSFGFNYIGTGQYKSALVPALMFRPYGRVMVLHVVILGGGFLVATLGSPLLPLALLVLLKTGLDLFGHLREHAVAVATPAPDLFGLV